jgi:signal transduction histidine kinase
MGLQARMTASYVLITAAAIVIVEAIVLVLVLPPLVSSVSLQSQVQTTATNYSLMMDKVVLSASGSGLPAEIPQLGYSNTGMTAGQVRPSDNGVVIPFQPGRVTANQPMSAALVLDLKSRIVASSFPAMFPVGSIAFKLLPVGKLSPMSGIGKTTLGTVTYAMEPVAPAEVAGPQKAVPGAGGPPKEVSVSRPLQPGGKGGPIGWVYVQVPGTGTPKGPLDWVRLVAQSQQLKQSQFIPLTELSALLFVVVLPVGVLFGLLTTRGAVRRLRSLAGATLEVAQGELGQRVPTGGPGEVGQLEANFNTMAERLQRAVDERHRLVDDRARTEERARIARELHDSISQDLFSIGLIAGGLQKALPPDSPLQAEVRAMRKTIDGTMNEMRAMLLELRPAALDERGLVPALTDLCAAYAERLGVAVELDLEPMEVPPPADHALLRIAQEGLANAVRHADAGRITLRLFRQDGRAELVVSDDGRGFDQETASAHGLGLRVMQERARELGGAVTVTSHLGRGTELTAWLPALIS